MPILLYHGRSVRLYQKHARPGAPWYYSRLGRGVNLQTADPTTAKMTARLLLAAEEQQKFDAMRALLDGAPPVKKYSTCAEILAWLEKTPLPVRARTKLHYAQKFTLFVRKISGQPLEKVSAGILSPETVSRYFAAAERAAVGAQAEANRRRRTWLSDLAHVGAVLTPTNADDMARAGLLLPDLAPFRAEIKIRAKKFARGAMARADVVPDALTISTTLALWLSLPRNDFIAVGLMLGCGLRKSTVAQARWDWIKITCDGRWTLSGQAEMKDGGGAVRVRPLEPFWSQFLARCAADHFRHEPEEYMLAGTETERCDTVFRRVSKFLRDLGWQTHNTNHALRALAVGTVLKSEGLESAREFAGHKHSATTEKSYTYIARSLPVTTSPPLTPSPSSTAPPSAAGPSSM